MFCVGEIMEVECLFPFLSSIQWRIQVRSGHFTTFYLRNGKSSEKSQKFEKFCNLPPPPQILEKFLVCDQKKKALQVQKFRVPPPQWCSGFATASIVRHLVSTAIRVVRGVQQISSRTLKLVFLTIFSLFVSQKWTVKKTKKKTAIKKGKGTKTNSAKNEWKPRNQLLNNFFFRH